MNSDSDSDGSHISSTPPRHQSPPSRSILLSSAISKSKTPTTITTTSRPFLKLKKPKPSPSPSNPNPNPTLPLSQQNNPPLTPLPPPNLPFQIHRFSHHSSSSQHNAFETIPPNRLYLSNFASFSKIQRTNINLESTEADSFPNTETARSEKAFKKHPNLISGNDISSFPAKKPKNVGEGNFVKLNMNGRGGKFKRHKGKRRNYGDARKVFNKSTKRKLNAGENGDLSDEDSFVNGIQQNKEKLGFDYELIEEAVRCVRNEASDENLLRLLMLSHGFDSFKDGQLDAIRNVISGKSTMLVLPTGAGKSLCYQLPAVVLPGITLVVSPLVALMIDQLKQLPPVVRGGILSSDQTLEEFSETVRLLQEGAIKVLFVSPERFLNPEFTTIISATSLISLVVVDEAHCISEWSHNFRPSYMRLRGSILREKFNVKCILAMTATATSKTLHEVMCALEIPPTNLIRAAPLRDNLQLSVSLSGNRMKDLMTLLKTSPFLEVRSVIVYCKFKAETDLISKYLCDNKISAKSYHGSIPANNRRRTQELFCSNKIRVVVATVAFGMGLDKRDVGAIIHYSLPESLEAYVQEIGRAGRNGSLSYCHLLFDDITYFKLRSLMYSDGVDEYSVNRFLDHVFSNDMGSHGNICSLVKGLASRKFDMNEEVMLTILTYLELGEVQYLQLLPQINVTGTLNFHQTSPALLSVKDTTIAAILKKSETKHGQYVFDIPTVANNIGVQASELFSQLQGLKLKGEITYELKDPAYCYIIVDAPKDVCSLTAHLTKCLSDVENSKVRRIDTMFNAAAFAVKGCDKMQGCSNSEHTSCLQRKILAYFNSADDNDNNVTNKMYQSSPFLRADIKVFLQSNSHTKFTPRAVARIMQGISSPAFPSATWSRTHFWARYVQIDFKVVMEAAKAELMHFVGQDVV